MNGTQILQTDSEKSSFLTKELECRFKEVGFQYNMRNPLAIAKYRWSGKEGLLTFYAISYDFEEKTFYGFSRTHNDDLENVYFWNNFPLKMLQRLSKTEQVERDFQFEEKRLFQCIEEDGIEYQHVLYKRQNHPSHETLFA